MQQLLGSKVKIPTKNPQKILIGGKYFLLFIENLL
jgi:hypothetical protein